MFEPELVSVEEASWSDTDGLVNRVSYGSGGTLVVSSPVSCISKMELVQDCYILCGLEVVGPRADEFMSFLKTLRNTLKSLLDVNHVNPCTLIRIPIVDKKVVTKVYDQDKNTTSLTTLHRGTRVKVLMVLHGYSLQRGILFWVQEIHKVD